MVQSASVVSRGSSGREFAAGLFALVDHDVQPFEIAVTLRDRLFALALALVAFVCDAPNLASQRILDAPRLLQVGQEPS